VTTVVSYAAYKSSKDLIDPMVADIIDALRSMSGAAHRQAVADWIVRRRATHQRHATPDEQAAIYRAFDAHIEMAKRRRPPPLLHTPLGAGSYRWALTPDALRLFGNARKQEVLGAGR